MLSNKAAKSTGETSKRPFMSAVQKKSVIANKSNNNYTQCIWIIWKKELKWKFERFVVSFRHRSSRPLICSAIQPLGPLVSRLAPSMIYFAKWICINSVIFQYARAIICHGNQWSRYNKGWYKENGYWKGGSISNILLHCICY